MRDVMQVLTGIGFLIGIFLFLNNYQGATSIISSIAMNTNQSIKTLQGR